MPYKSVWVKPEVFMKYRGAVIYRTYRYNEVDAGVSEYHFTTNDENTDYKEGDDGSGTMFDVRDLETWKEPPHPPYIIGILDVKETERRKKAWDAWDADRMLERYAKMAIKNAIKQGLLVDGVMKIKANP